jgi:hypothetical protein
MNMPPRASWLLLPIVVTLLALCGCGGGLSLGQVTGKVSVGGARVKSGTIMFHPKSGPAAVATIQPDGSYTLTTLKPGDGAVVGPHRVTIQATTVGEGSLIEPKSIDEEVKLAQKKAPGGKILVAGKVTWVVPEKYSRLETSDLTAQVASGPNTIDFEIPKKH